MFKNWFIYITDNIDFLYNVFIPFDPTFEVQNSSLFERMYGPFYSTTD